MIAWPSPSGDQPPAPGRPRPSPSERMVHPPTEPSVLTAIARRLVRQSRDVITSVDDVEAGTTDPEILTGLYHVDHRANIMARTARSLTVLSGGGLPATAVPVAISDLLQAGVAAIRDWQRVYIPTSIAGSITHPTAATAISHMVTECSDNLARLCPPSKQVQLTATEVAAGIAIELNSPAIPMSPDLLRHYKKVFAQPHAHLTDELAAGHLGLITVAHLASKYDIPIAMARSHLGGTHVVFVVPPRYLAEAPRPPQVSFESPR